MFFSVGSPIDVVKSDQPDLEYVDKVHGQVIEAIKVLFEEHKDKYIQNSKNAKLIIQWMYIFLEI